MVQFTSTRGALWSKEEAAASASAAASGGAAASSMAIAACDSCIARSVDPRPPPLNTVTLLKAASEQLGIGPGDAMHFAERLYLAGLVTQQGLQPYRVVPSHAS